VEELKEAISLGPEDTIWRKVFAPSSRVANCCANLVVLDVIDGTVHLAHHTVKEFLLSKDRSDSFRAFQFHLDSIDLQVGETCIRYLTLQDFQLHHKTGKDSNVLRVSTPTIDRTLPGLPFNSAVSRFLPRLFPRTLKRKMEIPISATRVTEESSSTNCSSTHDRFGLCIPT
jgi:hypothetical protein